MSASAIASICVWVTWMKVIPTSDWMRRSSPRICRRRNSSSADSGSSNSSTRGLVISARASAMRCCCPPESWAGRRSANSFMRTRASIVERALAPLGLADAAHFEVEGDVVGAAQMREQRIALEHHRRPALHRRRTHHVLAVDQHCTFGRRLVPRDHAQDRRLAAARRPQQTAVGAAWNLRSMSCHRDGLAEALGDAFELDAATGCGCAARLRYHPLVVPWLVLRVHPAPLSRAASTDRRERRR